MMTMINYQTDDEMIAMLRSIQEAVPRKYKGVIEGVIEDIAWIAPDPDLRMPMIVRRLEWIMQSKLVHQWHLDVISILWPDRVAAILTRIASVPDEPDPILADPVMHAWEGDKVIVISVDNVIDRLARVLLNEGEVYTVHRVSVHDSNTDVILKEFPEIKFNSCVFAVPPNTGS